MKLATDRKTNVPYAVKIVDKTKLTPEDAVGA